MKGNVVLPLTSKFVHTPRAVVCCHVQWTLLALDSSVGVSLQLPQTHSRHFYDHVANVDILSQCQVPSVEPQLRSKRLRWYGHMCRKADDRLTKCMLFGQVKGPGHVGKPVKTWNDVVLSDIHCLSISCPYEVAQNKSAWRA